MRLFSYAMEQKKISQGQLDVRWVRKVRTTKLRPIEWARHRSIEQRTYGFILIGMIVQVSNGDLFQSITFSKFLRFANTI